MYLNGYNRQKTMEVIKKFNDGSVARSENGDCSYRTEDGNCCIVGCFIPDSEYSTKMENKAASSVIEDYHLQHLMPLNKVYMTDLQLFHDNDIEEGLSPNEFYAAIEDKLIQWENNK